MRIRWLELFGSMSAEEEVAEEEEEEEQEDLSAQDTAFSFRP